MTIDQLKSYNVINTTLHPIRLIHKGEYVDFPPSDIFVRAYNRFHRQGDLVVYRKINNVEGLPDPESDTIYLVSGIVLRLMEPTGRQDLFAPDTGASAIRDENNHLAAITKLVGIDPEKPNLSHFAKIKKLMEYLTRKPRPFSVSELPDPDIHPDEVDHIIKRLASIDNL